MANRSPHSALKRLLLYIRPHKSTFYSASIYSVLNKLFDIMPEILIGVAVDTIVKQDNALLGKWFSLSVPQQLYLLGFLTFIIWLFESIFEYLYSIKWRNLAQTVQNKLRIDAYSHIQNADLQYFESIQTGQLASILNDDINQLERFLDSGFDGIIRLLTSTLVIGAIFFIISAKLALLAFLPTPLILFGVYYFRYLLEPRYAEVRNQAGLLNARFLNNLSGIATIKSYTAEQYEIASLKKQSNAYQKANSKAIQLSSAVTPIVRIAVLLGFLVTLVYGGYLCFHNQVAVGAYSVLVFLTQRLLWPLTGLAIITDQYYRAMASVDRVLNLLDIPIKIISKANSKPKQSSLNIRGEIHFDHVEFNYKPDHKILRDIQLHIEAGQTIGLVGSTGSGKSTLIKLLLRFYDPTQGTIYLDGLSLAEYPLENLRKAIAYVSQDIFLFDGTIEENIAYGSFTASQKEIIHAAKLAEAHEFIMRLPQQYQTRIGERGQQLSGGQRQRLAIARALLKDPAILILDEATSNVDNETEAAIQRSLNHIVAGRTAIIIAHRLSTVCQADIIYVLENGQIIEKGKHESLIRKHGAYANLWALQTGTLLCDTSS